MTHDNVENPKHYQFLDGEVIDYMKKCLEPQEFAGYIKGNVLKYRLRAGKKTNLEEDIKKALWYEECFRVEVLGEPY